MWTRVSQLIFLFRRGTHPLIDQASLSQASLSTARSLPAGNENPVRKSTRVRGLGPRPAIIKPIPGRANSHSPKKPSKVIEVVGDSGDDLGSIPGPEPSDPSPSPITVLSPSEPTTDSPATRAQDRSSNVVF